MRGGHCGLEAPSPAEQARLRQGDPSLCSGTRRPSRQRGCRQGGGVPEDGGGQARGRRGAAEGAAPAGQCEGGDQSAPPRQEDGRFGDSAGPAQEVDEAAAGGVLAANCRRCGEAPTSEAASLGREAVAPAADRLRTARVRLRIARVAATHPLRLQVSGMWCGGHVFTARTGMVLTHRDCGGGGEAWTAFRAEGRVEDR